jgi:Tfp pilus assembly protein PilF
VNRALAIACVLLAASASWAADLTAARLAIRQARYTDAEPLLKSAVDGAPHDSLDSAEAMNDLGKLYRLTAKYDQADSLDHQALAVESKSLGENDPRIAVVLENLGELHTIRGKYDLAEKELSRALAIRTKAFGLDNADTAESMTNLGFVYLCVCRCDEGEKLCAQAVEIQSKVLQPDDPARADGWDNLGNAYYLRSRLTDAGVLFKRSLELRAASLGDDHPDVGTSYDNLGWLYLVWGDAPRARRYYKLAAFTRENALGADHPDTIESQALAAEETDPHLIPADQTAAVLEKAFAAETRILGPGHWITQTIQVGLAQTYISMNRDADAEKLLADAVAAARGAFGENHVNTANIEWALADYYTQAANRAADAEPLYKQAVSTIEKLLGPDDRSLADLLTSYATCLRALNRDADAAQLEDRAARLKEADQKRNPIDDVQGPGL